MKAVKIFVHFVHYLAVALFGAVVGSAFEYQVMALSSPLVCWVS